MNGKPDRTCQLRELAPRLTALLAELVAYDLSRRAFLIVEDTVTGRFVQFATRVKPATGELLFDVPMLGIVLRGCPDAATGARWAVEAFEGPFALPAVAVLALTFGGEPAS